MNLEQLKKERERVEATLKAIDYDIQRALEEEREKNCIKAGRLIEKENDEDSKDMKVFSNEFVPFFNKLKPHKKLEVINILKKHLKETLEVRASEIDNEMAYLKDINQSL